MIVVLIAYKRHPNIHNSIHMIIIELIGLFRYFLNVYLNWRKFTNVNRWICRGWVFRIRARNVPICRRNAIRVTVKIWEKNSNNNLLDGAAHTCALFVISVFIHCKFCMSLLKLFYTEESINLLNWCHKILNKWKLIKKSSFLFRNKC